MAQRRTGRAGHLDRPEQSQPVMQWVVQLVGPLVLAVLAGVGYLFTRWMELVYRSFYSRLGITAAEADVSGTDGVTDVVVFGGFFGAVVGALLLAVAAGFLLGSRVPVGRTGQRMFVVGSYLLLAAAVVAAVMSRDTAWGAPLALLALCLLAGLVTPAIVKRSISPVALVLLVPTLAVDAPVIKFLRSFIEGRWFWILSIVTLLLVGLALLWVEYRLPNVSPAAARAGENRRWTRLSWKTHIAVLAVAVGVSLTLGVAYMVHLEEEAISAADQVRRYGYFTDYPEGLDVSVRPVTVQLLGKDDPMKLCSATRPVALSQLNRSGTDPVVLVRPLRPHTFEPLPAEYAEAIRLPASQYAVVQHLFMWSPVNGVPRGGAGGAGGPSPWAVPACADPLDRATWP